MSHGGEEEFDLEGSLVPLLDLVLQMVMFFMLCANFVMEQVNETIKLPSATAAKSLDKTVKDVLYVNINAEGHWLRTDGKGALTTPREMGTYARNALREGKGAETLVIIGAHQSARFEKVYMALTAIRAAGFQKLQLRAIMEGSMGSK